MASEPTLLARMFWAIAIFLGLGFASIFVHDLVLDWSQDPVTTSFDSVTYPVENVQYPTVTVCPPNRINYDWLGIYRNALNQVKFSCNDTESCDKVSTVRKDFEVGRVLTVLTL